MPDLKSVTVEIISHPTWDILLIFALLAGGFFYGISSGKRKIAATIIYTYVAFAITAAIPVEWFLSLTGTIKDIFIKPAIFVIILIALIFLFGTRHKKWRFAPANSWWKVFILSFTEIGFFIHLFLDFLPPHIVVTLAPITKNVLANTNYHVWWMIMPIVVIILLKRFEGKEE